MLVFVRWGSPIETNPESAHSVLIVDDDQTMLDLLKTALRKLGYQCITANSSDAALEQLTRKNVDLLITDFNMPGGSGVDLISEMRKRDQRMPVFLMTGDVNVMSQIESKEIERVLLKPFSIGSLGRAVGAVLGT